MKNINTPTGNILVLDGEYGKLECLSLGDYGKDKNIKSSFMGLDREINGVEHTDLLPLTEKWVITISTQYGCSMGCSFCDVPKVGPGKNATQSDMLYQIFCAMKLHPEIKKTERLNIHFARMGEPTFNPNVLSVAWYMDSEFNDLFHIHPVVSTIMPKNNKELKSFLKDWMQIKNHTYQGNAGLQISVNSTNKTEREKMFNGNARPLATISGILSECERPVGRKITLNFALANYEIDERELKKYFSPKHYLIKITPMHVTNSCKENNIKTDGGYENYYPYKDVENRLKNAGYDVIVFIPSKEEDESRITCGNAILSDEEYKK